MNAQRLERIWYAGEPAPVWLRALEPVYRVLRSAARLPWRLGLRRPERLPACVVVVGNVVVGGTGKTPLVVALVEVLRAHGRRPGVVSRGYGGSARVPMLLGEAPDPAVVGDEPALIRRRTGVPVAVGRDRVAAARLLVAEGVDTIVADDGLQNPSLARDLELCVIDGKRRFGNGRLLPAGPLREPLARLAAVDWRICNGSDAHADEVPMVLRGDVAVSLTDPARELPLASLAGTRVHAVAGIGHPDRFFDGLRAHGIEVIPHPLPDHHAMRADDLAFGDGLRVLMTEKDAVKCGAFAEPHHAYVPVGADLPAWFLEAFLARCDAARR